VVVTCRPIGILKMEDEGGVEGAGCAHRQEAAAFLRQDQARATSMSCPAADRALLRALQGPGKGQVGRCGWKVDAANKEILDGIANYAKG
jgi:inorganic pyrophosphatase